MSPDVYERLVKRLQDQLSLVEGKRMTFMDKYFPQDKHGYAVRKKYNRFFDNYAAALKALIEQIDKTSAALPRVIIGSEVALYYEDDKEEDAITICFPEKADPDNGFVSFLSPIASQLLLRRVNETVELKMPSGLKRVNVRKITFVDF